MASDDALWAKLHDLELQLAAYKLLRAARGDDAGADAGGRGLWAAEATCRGRQYEAYMRRRDARREAASSAEPRPVKAVQPRGTRAVGRGKQPEVVKRMPAVSVPSTPRWDSAALPRIRTVNGAGAAGSPARSSHHQRRNSVGVPADFGDVAATPRPFLRRGTGTGGAVARLRTPRVHDLPSIDVAPSTPRRPPPLQEFAHAARHVRSVSELPFDTAALASPQAQARVRKRWGSPERPPAMFSGADSHRDFSKGLKKLLSFVRKGGKSAADQPLPFPAPSPRGSAKPVSKGWSACSLLDVPFDRASLEGHQFPMTRTVGISG